MHGASKYIGPGLKLLADIIQIVDYVRGAVDMP